MQDMELDVNVVIARYQMEVARLTHEKITAEAQVEALRSELAQRGQDEEAGQNHGS